MSQTTPNRDDPRSFDAAVQHAVVHEAERIVLRATEGPTPMQRLTRSLFDHLRPDSTEEG